MCPEVFPRVSHKQTRLCSQFVLRRPGLLPAATPTTGQVPPRLRLPPAVGEAAPESKWDPHSERETYTAHKHHSVSDKGT